MTQHGRYTDMSIYYDTKSNPHEPGWVLRYSYAEYDEAHQDWDEPSVGDRRLTEPLDADTADEARHEAARFLGVPEADIREED